MFLKSSLVRQFSTFRSLQLSTTRYTIASKDELEKKLPLLEQSGWILSDDKKSISKKYEFDSFINAWSFLTQVALHSHLKGHHPKIENLYNKVNLTLHTDDVDSLTKTDILMANRFDKFLESPKSK